MLKALGRRGMRVRAASAGVALLFTLGLLVTERSEDYGIPFPLMLALWALALPLLFFMGWASEDAAAEKPFAFFPPVLLLPALAWLPLFQLGWAGENSLLGRDLGRWRLFGADWSTAGLYLLLLFAALVYNLARVTLARVFPAR